MNQVPRTFCITLRETPKRKELAIKYFKEVGLNAEMFDGIHGKSFGLRSTVPNYSVIPGREYFITQGAVGCLLSHLTLWNILLHQPEEEFFIVEDDALLGDNFFERFDKFKLELPSDWELVYVGWFPPGGEMAKDPPTQVSDNVITIFPAATHAYLVKKSALKTLIETNQVAWDTLDTQIAKRSLPKLKHYAFKTPLITQRSVPDLKEETWFSLCHDFAVDPEWLKEKNKNSLGLGNGWHPLEKNYDGYMIWSDGRGEFIFDEEWDKMEIEFIAEGDIEQKLRVICPQQEDKVFEIKYGKQTISFPISGAKSVILVTDTFRPIDIFKTSDYRRLGIRLLKGIHLTSKDGKITAVSLYSMYGQKKLNETSKTDGVKITRMKYSHEEGKINVSGQISFNHHRSGWSYVLNLLSQFHREDATLFDGWMEKTFAWQREEYSQLRLIPYREPWVGVFHNPPNTPSWFSHNSPPAAMLYSKEFQESLGTCRGIYVLSKYHQEFLKCFIKTVPVEMFYLPTEIPDLEFSFDEFVKNDNKKIINIGWWCRKLSSIYQLDVDHSVYQKIRIIPPASSVHPNVIEKILSVEAMFNKHSLTDNMIKSVVDVRYMPSEEYDETLSKNIAFLDMYDSSANNIVVECIARGTPILINPLPSVVEYLGEDYPFYFNTLNEAEKKVKNIALIKATHEYLTSSGIAEKITGDYFLKTIREGGIWKSLQ